MAKNTANAHAYNGSNYAIWTAPFGTTAPTTFPVAGVTPTGYYEAGILSDNGITEGHDLNENDIYDMAGTLVRVVRNQERRSFTFEALENNAVVAGLLYPGSTLTTTGGTAEAQTISISGTPTGGTFTATLPGYGSISPAFNATAPAVQSSAQAVWGIAVTVALATNVYTFTFPVGTGNVAQMSTVGTALTGGTTPAATAATTVPGVQGTNARAVIAGTGRNLRSFIVDMVDGTVSRRYTINNGEAVQSGTVAYTGSGVAVYQFTLSAYTDVAGAYYTIYDNDPGAAGLFA